MAFPRRYAPVAVWVTLAATALATPQVAQAQRRCRVADVAVSPAQAEVRVGENAIFTATGYDAAGNVCDDATFTWSSSNTAASTMDANGFALGVSAGTAVITARWAQGGLVRTGTAAVTVSAAVANQAASTAMLSIPGYSPVPGRPAGPGYAAYDRQPDGAGPAAALFVDPLQLSMVRGEWRTIDFRAMRTDGQNAARVPISFAVEPGGERIISVDSLGIVSSLGDAGVATVRLTVPNQPRIAYKQVRVEVRADSLSFNRRSFSIAPGTVDTLSVFIPAQARALNNPAMFQFRSSDSTKVRVNPVNPVIEAVAPGTARIIAQSSIYPEIVATVHVHRPVASLVLEPADTIRTIAIGGSTRVRAAALGQDGAPIPEAPITMMSPDTGVVSFDSATGTVTGRRSGLATISIQVPTSGVQAITRFIRVRVVAGGLAVARRRFGMGVGEHQPLEVTLMDDAGRPVGSANSYMRWSASPDSVLRVDNGNDLVALKPGFARLTGRSSWDSTIALEVFVVGDLLVTGQYQGRRELLMKWNGGQNTMPLTSDSTFELQAAWSPDLTRIAYTARPLTPPPGMRTIPSTLYLMRPDGTGRVKLTDDSSIVRFPSFVGNGKLIFDWNEGGRPPQVWIGDLRGDSLVNLHLITANTPSSVPNTAPAATRDGRRLAYVSLRETSPGSRPVYALYQAAIDGSNERLRTQAPSGQRLDNPVYSPDGATLYFLRSEAGPPPGQRVFRIAADGAPGDTAVAVTPPGLFVSSFSVSGDGSLLALGTLETVRNSQIPHLVLYPIATGQAQMIDAGADEQPGAPSFRPATTRPAASPAAPAR